MVYFKQEYEKAKQYNANAATSNTHYEKQTKKKNSMKCFPLLQGVMFSTATRGRDTRMIISYLYTQSSWKDPIGLLIEAADYGLRFRLENQGTWRERDLRFLPLLEVAEL